MRFRLEKCIKATLRRGKIIKKINVILDKETEMIELDQPEAYKIADS